MRIESDRGELEITSDREQAPEYYEPMHNPELLFEFANISTAQQALAFADSYGFLGQLASVLPLHQAFKHGIPGIDDPQLWVDTIAGLRREYLTCKEPLSYWLNEAELVRKALKAWAALETGDSMSVVRIFPLRVKPEFDRRRGLQFAKQWFINLVNLNLTAGTESFLSMDDKGNPRPHISPRNLRFGLWLQVAEVVSGTKRIRPCEICGKWMDVSENNTNKRVHEQCSLRERMRRYRSKA
jgi:hypothetical protein